VASRNLSSALFHHKHPAAGAPISRFET
jgi:hypothetical protein